MSASLCVVGPGHNGGPPLVAEDAEIRAHLAESHTALTARTAALAEMVNAFLADFPCIDDDEGQARAADVAAQSRKHLRLIETRRKEANEPFRVAVNTVNGWFKAQADALSAVERIEALQTAYARAMAAKRQAEARARAEAAREEAARRLAEAAATVAPDDLDRAAQAQEAADAAECQANAAPAEHSRTHSDYGTVSSLRRNLVVRVTDIQAVPPEFLMVNEAMLKAAYRGGRTEVPGIEFSFDTKIQNR